MFFQLKKDGNKSRRISSHSLKATGISWAAKFGIDDNNRAILARRATAAQNPTALYSIDLISAALRLFVDVIQRIRARWFQPDKTRGGMLTPPPGTPAGFLLQQGHLDGSVTPPAQTLAGGDFVPEESKAAADGYDDAEVSLASPSPFLEELPVPVKEEIVRDGSFVPGEIVEIEDGINLMQDWNVDSDLDEDDDSETDSSSSSSSQADDDAAPAAESGRRVPLSGLYTNCRSLVVHALKGTGKFRCGRKLTSSYEAAAEMNGLRCGKCFTD